MKLSDLKPNPNNPRKIEPERLDMLKRSLDEYGDLSGFVFNETTRRLCGGHQRGKVLPPDSEIFIEEKFSTPTRTGTTAIGHVVVDGEKYAYRQVAWDEDKEKAANIAANKHGGEWDTPKLADWLLDLDAKNYDLDLTGFTAADIEDICAPYRTMPDEDPDSVPAIPKIAKTKRGELWLLGEHRLLIDDCTDKSNVEMLMGGAKADVVFTDPPYGMNLDTEYSSSWGKQSNTSGNIGPRTTKNHAPVIGDDQDFDPAHIFETFYGTKDVLLFGADYFCQKIPPGGSWIVWDKTGGNESLDNTGFQSRFELCWSKAPHRRKIYRSTWIGVAGMHHKDDSNRMHPTQKPVKLCEQILNDLDGITVADPYLGSGSTLIACEKTGRRCYGMEIAPLYADVIIERWEKFTGKQATREDGVKYQDLVTV